MQFVPLHKYLSKNGLEQQVKSQSHLAKEVLQEIPEQLTSYMKSRGFKPQMTTTQNTPSSSLAVTPIPMF